MASSIVNRERIEKDDWRYQEVRIKEGTRESHGISKGLKKSAAEVHRMLSNLRQCRYVLIQGILDLHAEQNNVPPSIVCHLLLPAVSKSTFPLNKPNHCVI
ncbi:hypothetical protein ALC53_04724 [Atta colombica]|uniref:Uncharacterized protein n=1 Tax=Atta colombica TaxID=520822 RepID=A0A195BJW7_9HYME|nr:hypothetical protein ALC53_04724 [Atta colombica]